MMPFEERWGIIAIELVAEAGLKNPKFVFDTSLNEATLAWRIACELQAAHDVGIETGVASTNNEVGT